jgi:hypothetical protein
MKYCPLLVEKSRLDAVRFALEKNLMSLAEAFAKLDLSLPLFFTYCAGKWNRIVDLLQRMEEAYSVAARDADYR